MANFKQYRQTLGGNTKEDPLTVTPSGTQMHSARPRDLWLVDDESQLPTAGEGAADGDFAVANTEGTFWKRAAGAWTQLGGAGGAPSDADYLVGTANGGLSAEIVVGTSPAGELGGTWASPTVDASHSGSTHAATQAAAEATAAGELATHAGAADPHTGYVREADANWVDLTDAGETALHSHAGGGSTVNVEEDNVLAGAAGSIDFGTGFDVTFAAAEAEIALDLSESTTFTDHSARHEDGGADEISITGLSGIPAELTTHAGAADPHTVYRLESADHTHQSTGAQAGTLDHGLALTGLSDDDHPQYRLESESGTFTIGIFILAPAAAVYHVWRAPFACTVTRLSAYGDAGNTTTVNAAVAGVDVSVADLTAGTAAWATDATLDGDTSVASGESISFEVVAPGTAAELAIQIDLTRP